MLRQQFNFSPNGARVSERHVASVERERFMSILPSPSTHSRLRQVWEIASDLLIATALIWTLPLLLGAVRAAVRLLLEAR